MTKFSSIKSLTFVVERLEQKFANPNIVEQFSAIIDHVDHVQRLGVLAVFAHVIEHLFHRPAGIDRDQVRRHQPADAAFGITEERLGDAAFLRREQLDQLARRRARQFLEQRRAIVRRHFVEDPDDLLVRHRAQQFLLRLDVEIFENVGRQIVRQDAEDDRPVRPSEKSVMTSAISAGGHSEKSSRNAAKFRASIRLRISGWRIFPTMMMTK